jgi:hypothetical protein
MDFLPRGASRAFPTQIMRARRADRPRPFLSRQVFEKWHEGGRNPTGNTWCDGDHGVGRGAGLNLRGMVFERWRGPGEISEQTMIPTGCVRAKGSLLRDVASRVKGLFVAMPQIECN